MKCPKCNSENVQIQAKEVKPQFTVPLSLTLGGLGLVFLGILGAIIGVVLGIIIGVILASALPSGHQSILVCQSCGYVSRPMAQTTLRTETHPLFCSSEESNLDVVRNDIAKGTIVIIRVTIDNYAPFDIGDNQTISLKVPNGEHLVAYEQINGIGKKKNKGQLNVLVSEKKTIKISFTRQGLIIE